MVVVRIWTRSAETNTGKQGLPCIDIWDGGSYRYERWPLNKDIAWEVVKREITETGFIETLNELPAWETPFKTMWKESVPILSQGPKGFRIPGWSVEIGSKG
jgi:hypothetical protein